MSSAGDSKEGKEESALRSSTDSRPSTSNSKVNENMKRTAVKQRIERYYYQLTEGCGRDRCSNENCASSTSFKFKQIDNNSAAVTALSLFKGGAQLCEQQPFKVAKSTKEGDEEAGATCSSSKAELHEASGSKETENVDSNGKPTSDTAQCVSSASDSLPTVSTASEESMECISTMEAKPTDSVTTPQQDDNNALESSSASTQSLLADALAQLNPVSTKPKEATASAKKDGPVLTEEKLHSLIEECRASDIWSPLSRVLYSVYSSSEALVISFRRQPSSKEELRSMEVDHDKDTDDTTESEPELPTPPVKDNELTLDLEAVRRAYSELFGLHHTPWQEALINALLYLATEIEFAIRYSSPYEKDPNYLNVFMILLEIPTLFHPEYIDSATPKLLKCIGMLPVSAQAKLAKVWSQMSETWIRDLLHGLQQLITVKCITTEWSRSYVVNDNQEITAAVRVMKILYYANMLAGKFDPLELIEAEKAFMDEVEESLNQLHHAAMGRDKERNTPKVDPLGKELGITVFSCRKPLVDFEDFVNEPLSDVIEMDKDYTYYRGESPDRFTFMHHSFILTTAVKNMGLYFDNRIRMIEERRSSVMQSVILGAMPVPYLKLRIKRDRIIDDALVNLEMAAMDNPQDLKKQLYVEFEGEQGIDEGGVSKEFFQLVVEEIFNPDIGMFTHSEDTGTFWFNHTSFENDAQFTLIGIVLGLAIYNNIILDVHFPMLVYRKLMGKKGIFEDLKDTHPTLYHSLLDMLKYEGDVEDTFMQTFQLSHHDVFGNVLTFNLKPDGDQIPVTNQNRQEFVDLYADFLLNKSIEKQFKAFYRGFHMVTDESPIKMLFRPEEIETLVCGSKKFDFHALEDSTEYDGGFDVASPTVRNFWSVVHEFTDEEKSKLLQFTTGSDRSPVGGLSKLKLIIARNGPDSDRLPTAHTCFNVLLLPDYTNKDKLKDRLLKAINYAKGFGML